MSAGGRYVSLIDRRTRGVEFLRCSAARAAVDVAVRQVSSNGRRREEGNAHLMRPTTAMRARERLSELAHTAKREAERSRHRRAGGRAAKKRRVRRRAQKEGCGCTNRRAGPPSDAGVGVLKGGDACAARFLVERNGRAIGSRDKADGTAGSVISLALLSRAVVSLPSSVHVAPREGGRGPDSTVAPVRRAQLLPLSARLLRLMHGNLVSSAYGDYGP